LRLKVVFIIIVKILIFETKEKTKNNKKCDFETDTILQFVDVKQAAKKWQEKFGW